MQTYVKRSIFNCPLLYYQEYVDYHSWYNKYVYMQSCIYDSYICMHPIIAMYIRTCILYNILGIAAN